METLAEKDVTSQPEFETFEHISGAKEYFDKHVSPKWYAHLDALKKPDAEIAYQPSGLLEHAGTEPEKTIERNGYLLKTRAELRAAFVEFKDQLSKMPDAGPKTVLLGHVSSMLSLLEIDPSVGSADADTLFTAIDGEWFKLYNVKNALVSALEIAQFLP